MRRRGRGVERDQTWRAGELCKVKVEQEGKDARVAMVTTPSYLHLHPLGQPPSPKLAGKMDHGVVSL